jgi:hypothetical protein
VRASLFLVLSACTVKGVVPPPNVPSSPPIGPDLEVCVPLDVRPAPERVGQRPGTAFWAFADVYEFTHHRGSTISRDAGLYPTSSQRVPGTSRPAQALAEALVTSLTRSGAFRSVSLGAACDESAAPPLEGALLWGRLDHAYGAVYLVSKRWRYSVGRIGDNVWMDTVTQQSSGPSVGYARATFALCMSGGCESGTVAGHTATEALRATPGATSRSSANIELGRALSELAGEVGTSVVRTVTGETQSSQP